MAGKSKKELQYENSKLKEEVKNLTTKNEELSNNSKCKTCDENSKNLKKHKDIHGIFKCVQCEKEFTEQWKMIAHMKLHDKYQCEQCEKTFKYADIKKKHIQISHENVKFYCHFFNNKKTCPYDDECVFLHEDSKICKYGKICERNYCMFKHDYNGDDNGDDIMPDNDDVIENIECEDSEDEESEILNVNDVDETTDHENEIPNRTFINPSQCDKDSSGELFKCEMCDFASARNDTIKNHKEVIHNWCPHCYSSFNSQKILKNHMKDIDWTQYN